MKETNIIYYFDFEEIAIDFLGFSEHEFVKFRIPMYDLNHFKEGDTIDLNLDELQIGHAHVVNVGDDQVLLCRVSGTEVYAIENSCSHDEGPLSEGALEGVVIECPRHGAQFDVTDGRALRMPAASPILSFPTRLTSDGWVEVDLEEA